MESLEPKTECLLVTSISNNDKEQLLQITKEKGYNIQHHMLLCGSTWSKAHRKTFKDLFSHCDERTLEKDMWGNSLFHWVAFTNTTWLIPTLKDMCIPSWTKNDMGLLPVNVAISMQNSEILEEFIASGIVHASGDSSHNSIDATLQVPSRNDHSKRDELLVQVNPLGYMYMHGMYIDVLHDYNKKYRCIPTYIDRFGDIIFLIVHFNHANLLRRVLKLPTYEHLKKRESCYGTVNAHNGLKLPEYAQVMGSTDCVIALLENFDDKEDGVSNS